MHLRYILVSYLCKKNLPYKVYLFCRLFIRNSERLAASNSSNSSSYYSFIFKWLQQQMPNIIFLQIHIIQVECVWLEVTAWNAEHFLQCFHHHTYLCIFRDDRSLYDNCLLSDSRIDNGFGGRYNNDLESRYNWAVYRINPDCNGGGGYGKSVGLTKV